MKSNADGFVLITDDATGDKIHKVLCEEVTSPDFYEKVIANKAKHGRYVWSDMRAELKREAPKASSCGICKA